MRAINIITLLLIIIGGLNWGLVGLFNFDLVTAIFGSSANNSESATSIARVVFVIVALSALWQLIPFSQYVSRDAAVAPR